MKKVFVSVPMTGKSFYEVQHLIDEAIQEYLIKDIHGDLRLYDEAKRNTKFVHNNDGTIEKYIDASNAKIPNLVYLGVAINRMANCDDVIFARGWENAKGCQVEKLVYDLYFNKP